MSEYKLTDEILDNFSTLSEEYIITIEGGMIIVTDITGKLRGAFDSIDTLLETGLDPC